MPVRYKTTVQDKTPSRDKTRAKSLLKLREELIERRDILRRDLSEEEDELTFDQNNPQVGDLADAALDSAENELEYQLVEVGTREFGQIERAIKRFEEGTYGICEACQAPIPIARLKVLPFAGMCVRCQQLADEENNRGSFSGWKTYDFVVAPSPSGTHSFEKDYDY